MSQKTLMLLGGSRYLLPVIESAHELGLRVVTCDYLPDNFAHRYSDEYVNVSIVDEQAVLEAARKIGADGIMSFAADPGVLSAAFAAEQLGLPYPTSYEATRILQNKELFREFLQEHGFNSPWSLLVTSVDEAREQAANLEYPAIVKPTDSAGSKGVTRVNRVEDLEAAVAYALGYSISDRCIVEQFLEKQGYSSGTDCFTVEGDFRCVAFNAQIFDEASESPFVPGSSILPGTFSEEAQRYFQQELQRLADLLGFRSGIFNIEVRECTDGRRYVMEVSPRAGGNRLAELLRAASGVDLIRASVEAAVGIEPSGVAQPVFDGYWCLDMLTSRRSGRFGGLDWDPKFREEHLRDESVWIDLGDRVEAFSSANHAFGSFFLRFESMDDVEAYLACKENYIRALVDA